MYRRFFGDRHGNITIVSSVMITSLVGVSGLVAEFGSGLLTRMQDQRIADAAAMAGGTVYAATGSSTSMSGAISRIASMSGSPDTISGQIVESPTGDGNEAVRVTVQSSVPLVLSRILWQQDNLAVSATAYAELKTTGLGGTTASLVQ